MASGWEEDVGTNDGHSGVLHSENQYYEQQRGDRGDDGPQGFAVRIRGIPFQESEHTVHKWLQERAVVVRNGVLGIHFVYSNKRQWSGDAYAALNSEKDLQTALAQDQAQMNHRYLEIFPCSMLEMEDVLKRTGYYRLPNDYTVRLRGLEFKVTREDILAFFKGLDIASGLDGIFIIKNADGRQTGEGYVLFENKASVEAAVQKHKEKLGDRYIEIFLACSADLRDALAGDGGGSRGRDQGGYGRGGQSHQNDEHFPRGGGPAHSSHTHSSHPAQENEPRQNNYKGFYPPNDVQYSGPNDSGPDHGPFRGGPAFAGYDHGMPARCRSRDHGLRLYMRGLPWTCTDDDIEKFFGTVKTKKITKNVSESHVFDGSAWVDFLNEEDMNAAKRLHKTNMGHRYIELFTEQEVDDKRLGTSTGRSAATQRGSDRGSRSARGGREGAGPRGGGGARHTQTRGGSRFHKTDSVQSDYGRVGNPGPRTPYDRPLQYRQQSPPSSGMSNHESHSSGYASYTSFRHQPVQQMQSPYGNGHSALQNPPHQPAYGNGGGGGASYGYNSGNSYCTSEGYGGLAGGDPGSYGFSPYAQLPPNPPAMMDAQNPWNSSQPQYSMPYPAPHGGAPNYPQQPPPMQYGHPSYSPQ